MKKALLGIFIMAGFAACKSQNDKPDVNLTPIAPVAYTNSVLTDTATVAKNNEEPAIETVVYRKRPKKKIVYFDEPAVSNPAPAPATTTNTEVVPATQPVPEQTNTTDASTSTNNNGTGNTASTPVPEKKKGWSNAAKGTVIGAVGGAVAGAVINGKNRGKGAVIGGIIGAAGGYILGKKKDKKNTDLAGNLN